MAQQLESAPFPSHSLSTPHPPTHPPPKCADWSVRVGEGGESECEGKGADSSC